MLVTATFCAVRDEGSERSCWLRNGTTIIRRGQLDRVPCEINFPLSLCSLILILTWFYSSVSFPVLENGTRVFNHGGIALPKVHHLEHLLSASPLIPIHLAHKVHPNDLSFAIREEKIRLWVSFYSHSGI
jgi:hypothetical protein